MSECPMNLFLIQSSISFKFPLGIFWWKIICPTFETFVAKSFFVKLFSLWPSPFRQSARNDVSIVAVAARVVVDVDEDEVLTSSSSEALKNALEFKKIFATQSTREHVCKNINCAKIAKSPFFDKKICHTMMHLSKSDTSFCSLMTTYWPMIDRLAIFDEKIIKKYSLPNPTIQIWDWKLLKTFL